MACTSSKNAVEGPEVRLLKSRATVQKVFPGVSGTVHYFIEYEAEFDIETDVEIEFLHFLIGETEIPVNTVSVGTKLLNTDQGEHLKNDTKGVRLKASRPVHHTEKEAAIAAVLVSPEKLILVFKAGKDTLHHEIPEIVEAPNEYRPAAPAGNQNLD